MKDAVVTIKVYNGYIHYLIDDDYLGLLVFAKGELSDHRAIIRKNRMTIDHENLYQRMRTGLFTLLNHYLAERSFVPIEELEKIKMAIVERSEKNMKVAVEKIIGEQMSGNKDD